MSTHCLYLNLYRNGIIESVTNHVFDVNQKIINDYLLEKKVLEAIEQHLNFYKGININPPIFICITLLGVQGYALNSIQIEKQRYSEQITKIDRDILEIPEISIELYKDNYNNLVRPSFDIIWNTCGKSKSENFDDQNNFIKKF